MPEEDCGAEVLGEVSWLRALGALRVLISHGSFATDNEALQDRAEMRFYPIRPRCCCNPALCRGGGGTVHQKWPLPCTGNADALRHLEPARADLQWRDVTDHGPAMERMPYKQIEAQRAGQATVADWGRARRVPNLPGSADPGDDTGIALQFRRRAGDLGAMPCLHPVVARRDP
jgi:hypothetical protein